MGALPGVPYTVPASSMKALAVSLVTALLVACGGHGAGVTPRAVLDAYLEDLIAARCVSGRTMGTDAFDARSGDLCGDDIRVTSYVVKEPPATPGPGEVVFATTLTTTGSTDGSIEPGRIEWFFVIRRQADGSWRIASAGGGP